jgi:hypothetical protein
LGGFNWPNDYKINNHLHSIIATAKRELFVEGVSKASRATENWDSTMFTKQIV